MRNYVDKYGFYHDRVVSEDKEPSSNNPAIYTAYAKLLGLPVDRGLVADAVRASRTRNHIESLQFSQNRLPNQTTPPMSRDEIIGLASLGLLDYYALANSGFVFHYEPEANTEKHLSFKGALKAIKALWAIRNKHRNEVWKGKHYDGYTLAFRLSAADRYYVKTMYNKKPTILETIAFHSSALFTSLQRSKGTKGVVSAKNIIYLQLNDMQMYSHPAMKLMNLKNQFDEYFEKGHIFREAV